MSAMSDDVVMPSEEDPFPLQVLEPDETVPPRPEEEQADELRATPDPH